MVSDNLRMHSISVSPSAIELPWKVKASSLIWLYTNNPCQPHRSVSSGSTCEARATVALKTVATACRTFGPWLESMNCLIVHRVNVSRTMPSTRPCKIGRCYVLKDRIGILVSSSVLAVSRRWLYVAAILLATLIEETPIIESESVPIETLQICRKKSARWSVGLVSLPSRAANGSRTCSKLVIEWSNGLVPGRVSRTRDVISRRIFEELHSYTRNGFTPWSSCSTIRWAKTTATRGALASGVVGPIAFAAAMLRIWRSKLPSGSRVAVVSRLRASSPYSISVSINSPQTLKAKRSASRLDRSRRLLAKALSVPMQRFRWMVTIIKALMSRVEITVRHYFLLFHARSETRTPYS